ncbi:hypothetical protein EDD18DRAFT_1085518 [Armillaria luteobubalina]|uniref:DUF1996 domain-containing protein n=1 Tax=Armillaria luteobubalina TaxID=153913 RepID=A0AA39UG61_9AGAR|nr:hypothetical protein EDD18DRAFT_1085518 [Armillaria luteobubalina]
MTVDNVLTIQRMDPIQYLGTVGSHVHSGKDHHTLVRVPVLGGSSFSLNLSMADLRGSDCTSIPVQEDKSNYWYLKKDGSFVTVNGSAMMYTFIDYLFSDNSSMTTPFPNDIRDPNLHTLNISSFTQQAITFLCLNFNSVSMRYNELPVKQDCLSGILLNCKQNFLSCWDRENVDSEDHKSHIAFPSMGPDNGTCDDPNYPVMIPQIFMEVHIPPLSIDIDTYPRVLVSHLDLFLPSRSDKPCRFSNGDPTGYGYHTNFFNGWESGVLQRAINKCHCNLYGNPSCCIAAGVFTINQNARCFISNFIDEITMGNLSMLPGANPVQVPCYEEYTVIYMPAIVGPVYVSMEEGVVPNGMMEVVVPARMVDGGGRKLDGRCLWTGGARITTVPQVVLMVGVVMAVISFA